jgi:hypothetical protein
MSGKVYKIISKETDNVYYGSTMKPLAERLIGHRKDYKSWQKSKDKYVTSFEVVKYDDAEIILMEEFECVSKVELRLVEGRYIRNSECVNKVIPGRSQKEWSHDNKDEILKYLKQYREDNREQIAKNRKQYKADNREKINEKHACPCGGKYTQTHKLRHFKSKKHLTYLLAIASSDTDEYSEE